jgi:hypothetical protein
MAKSCKEIAQSLVDCMKNTHCVQNGGNIRECMKKTEGEELCKELKFEYFSCRRGALDMRTRIQGQKAF